MAPRPRPTSLKVVRGQAPPSALDAEPKPPPLASDDPPPLMRLSARQKRFWRDLLPRVKAMRVMTAADAEALVLLCQALAETVEAELVLRREGRTFWSESERGAKMMRAHPMVHVLQDSWRRARLMMMEFGLTPAARAKAGTTGSGTVDAAEAWLSGQPGADA